MDASQDLEKTGTACGEEVQRRVDYSRSRLNRADDYVRKALRGKREGNLLSARANLLSALEIYPRYYWVQTLLKNVERSISAEVNALKGEAKYLESKGDLEGALSRVEEARHLATQDPYLKSETARLEENLKRSREKVKALQYMEKARDLMEAGRFDEAERLLTQGPAPDLLGEQGEKMAAAVRARRREIVRQRFNVAREAEQKGDLDVAAGHTLYILRLSSEGEPETRDIVEYSRLLGMKFFSAGELTKAREIWSLALTRDPGNSKLENYLKEVDVRLDSLKRIRSEEGEKVEQ